MSCRSAGRSARSSSSTDSNSDLALKQYTDRTNKPNPRFEIKLEGLGPDLYEIDVTVRATTYISTVERSIRDYPDLEIKESDTVMLYRDDKILQRTGRVGSSTAPIQYHVFRDLRNEPTRSTRALTTSSTPTDIGEEYVASLPLPRFGSGDITTVAEIRHTYARMNGIDDPNTLILRLVGGLRTGPLEGNDWQYGKIAEWLPEDIVVTRLLRPSYLVLRGYGKEYLYQDPCAGGDSFGAGGIKRWLTNKLIRRVHPTLETQISVSAFDISLYVGERLLSRDTSLVEWTTEIEFRLPPDVEKAFTTEEEWLCPTLECDVCGETVPYEPPQVSANCAHEPSVCTPCVHRWVSKCLIDDGWNKARCPECSEPLAYHEVKAFASKEAFERSSTSSASEVLLS